MFYFLFSLFPFLLLLILFYFCSSIESTGKCVGVAISQWTAAPLKSQRALYTRMLTFATALPLIALARVEQDKFRPGSRCVKYTNAENTSTHSEPIWRMPIAVACSGDIMHEPWAEGLAEHAPSTATQNARMHTYACTHAHSRILSCRSCCFFSECKWIDC